MPILQTFVDASFNQPFVRFLRLNGSAISTMAGPVSITRIIENKFMVSVNPTDKVKWKIYKIDDGTLFYDGGETATARFCHILTLVANTLNANTDYLLRVEKTGTANTICELDIRTT